jgi:hypothetical protein
MAFDSNGNVHIRKLRLLRFAIGEDSAMDRLPFSRYHGFLFIRSYLSQVRLRLFALQNSLCFQAAFDPGETAGDYELDLRDAFDRSVLVRLIQVHCALSN